MSGKKRKRHMRTSVGEYISSGSLPISKQKNSCLSWLLRCNTGFTDFVALRTGFVMIFLLWSFFSLETKYHENMLVSFNYRMAHVTEKQGICNIEHWFCSNWSKWLSVFHSFHWITNLLSSGNALGWSSPSQPVHCPCCSWPRRWEHVAFQQHVLEDCGQV